MIDHWFCVKRFNNWEGEMSFRNAWFYINSVKMMDYFNDGDGYVHDELYRHVYKSEYLEPFYFGGSE
jgi:hypothetical protein